ncbi:hypothetical protein WMY93_032031 [Mugilogobius chulae]|uniref:Uncharacterized protein n=1 Tax=Mugilogobius chulae TaxID=88201 RepID=A0AAW0MKF2_9GOBI
MGHKHFGFGKYALAATFIHPYLHKRANGCTKTALKPQQSLAFIIFISLMLSGDIHQCPGPINNSTTTEGSQDVNTNVRSATNNLQVLSLSIPCYTFEQITHPNGIIPPASAVASPMTSLVAKASGRELAGTCAAGVAGSPWLGRAASTRGSDGETFGFAAVHGSGGRERSRVPVRARGSETEDVGAHAVRSAIAGIGARPPGLRQQANAQSECIDSRKSAKIRTADGN